LVLIPKRVFSKENTKFKNKISEAFVSFVIFVVSIAFESWSKWSKQWQ